MSTAAWYHCFSGIAGDMALGALVDAGADLDEVRAICERIPVSGWTLDAEPVIRAGMASTHVVVRCEETSVVRTYGHIAAMVEEARLPERVRRRALATFDALAKAEGRIHRRPPEQVHFPEVGELGDIVSIVGVGAGTRDLDGRPNVVQVVLGERVSTLPAGQPVMQLEVNVDDATGETLAHTVSALLDAGAHDAWVTPIVMKKGRPAYTVSALCDTALTAQIIEVVKRETGSLGVRGATLERWPSARAADEVEVAGYPV